MGDILAGVEPGSGVQPVCEDKQMPYAYDDCGWDYVDDVSGKWLNNTLVTRARGEEMGVMKEMKIWDVVDRPYGHEGHRNSLGRR